MRNFENAGKRCHGDLVFFSDQDDVWLPDKMERTRNVFQENPQCGLVLLCSEHIDAAGQLLPESRRDQKSASSEPEFVNYSVRDALYRWVPSWQGCNMAYRNSLKEIIYPIPSTLGHDQWILLLLAVLSDTLFLPSPTAQHRIHASNASRLSIARKNLLARCWYSLRRHQDPERYHQKQLLFEGLLERIQEHSSEIRHADLLPLYQRFGEHFQNRAAALAFPFQRPARVFSEWKNGNYAFCSKGFRDVLNDLLAIPFPTQRGDKPEF